MHGQGTLRIAIYHNLPSGGAKRTLYEATRRLAIQHHIDVFSLTSADHCFGDLRPHVAGHHIFVFRPLALFPSPFGRLNQAIRTLDLWRLEVISRAVADMVEAAKYDVLLVHPCRFTQAPSVLRLVRKTSTVYYCHEALRQFYEDPLGRFPERIRAVEPLRRAANRIDPLPSLYRRTLTGLDRRNIQSADRVLVNSEYTRQEVQRIYRRDAAVCYHGVDASLFRPLPVAKRDMVLSVGSLTPAKGFGFLIESLGRISPELRPELVVVSNFALPEERALLEQRAGALGVRLDLLTNVSDERLVELYNQARITLYAPVREPFGLVPLESMACVTPVVGVRDGGVPESIVHEQTGLLLERDSGQFGAAVSRLLADPALAMRMGRNGREHVLRHWTWDRAAGELENFLKVHRTG